MYWAIGYDGEWYTNEGGQPIRQGKWRIIAGPNINLRACARALARALLAANGCTPTFGGAYLAIEFVEFAALPLYGIDADGSLSHDIAYGEPEGV